MVVTMEEYQKTLEYQETMKFDVENIFKNRTKIGYQYMKVLMIHILQQQKYSARFFRQMGEKI